jgi:hypothetical protein
MKPDPRLAMPMEPGDRVGSLDTLLVQTGRAHGVFEETELKGVYDKEWPRWYAAYAVEHGIGALVGHPVTVDDLAAFLASSNAEFEHIEPRPTESWAAYTARRIAADL